MKHKCGEVFCTLSDGIQVEDKQVTDSLCLSLGGIFPSEVLRSICTFATRQMYCCFFCGPDVLYERDKLVSNKTTLCCLEHSESDMFRKLEHFKTCQCHPGRFLSDGSPHSFVMLNYMFQFACHKETMSMPESDSGKYDCIFSNDEVPTWTVE